MGRPWADARVLKVGHEGVSHSKLLASLGEREREQIQA